MSRYDVRFSNPVKQALSHDLPEKVAAAAFKYITGALCENAHRVGRQLQADQNFPFGGAAILIMVGVGLGTVKQISSQIEQRSYPSLTR